MVYLTMEEYNRFVEFQEITDEQVFQSHLAKASSVLDNITRLFYAFARELESDYPWRRDAFKRAVACQIDYFMETGHTTTEGLNSAPQSQSIGRTQISKASKFNASGANEKKSIVCDDVYLYLESTGLLNRGVG